jgi:hypothetical protein
MQKQPKILNYKNLNKEKYEYLQPHKTQNGYYQSICNYRLTQNQVLPFYFETPKLKTTSGIVRIENQYYIDLELPQSGDGGLFYDFLIKNDENNISICHSNSKEWFNQLMPLNIIENYYKTAILLRSNGQLPILRIKIPSYKGNILTEIFNIRKEKISDISCIQEGDFIVGIIEYTGLKFMKQNFSPCYDLQKIKIFKDNNFRAIPSGYIFSDTDDSINLNTISNKEKDSLLDQPIENFSDNKSINNTNEYKTIDIKKPIPIKLSNIITDTPEPNLHNNNNNISKSPEPIIKNTINENNINKNNINKDTINENNINENNINKDTINEDTINEDTIKSIDIEIQKNNNNSKKESLYDIIKKTTLDSLYMDDKLFLNNNKLIKNINMNVNKEKSKDEEDMVNDDGENREDIENDDGEDIENDDGEDMENWDGEDMENDDGDDMENDDGDDIEDDNGEGGEDGKYEDGGDDMENDDGDGDGDGDDIENDNGECGEDGNYGDCGEDGEKREELIIGEEEIDSDNHSDNDSNDDIDYNTLNDLEVIEFDE